MNNSNPHKRILHFLDSNYDIQKFEVELTTFDNGEVAHICPLCSRKVLRYRGCASGHIGIVPMLSLYHR